MAPLPPVQMGRLGILQAGVARFRVPVHGKVLPPWSHRAIILEAILRVAVAATVLAAAATRQEIIQRALVQQQSLRGRPLLGDVLSRLMAWRHHVGRLHRFHLLRQELAPAHLGEDHQVSPSQIVQGTIHPDQELRRAQLHQDLLARPRHVRNTRMKPGGGIMAW